MILVEVVDQVPKALLILRTRSEEAQVYLEVPLLIKLIADIVVEAGSGLKVGLELFVPTTTLIIAFLASATMDLLTYRNFQAWF